jgi:hypothetical protein
MENNWQEITALALDNYRVLLFFAFFIIISFLLARFEPEPGMSSPFLILFVSMIISLLVVGVIALIELILLSVSTSSLVSLGVVIVVLSLGMAVTYLGRHLRKD